VALVPIVSPPQKRKITTFDLEWIPPEEIPRPFGKKWPGPIYSKPMPVRLVGVYDEREGYRRYRSVPEFLENELVPETAGRWYYAHAGGLADMAFVFDEIIRHIEKQGIVVYKVRACFSGSAAIIVRVKKGRHVWTFLDSFWLLRAKLEKIGEDLGLNKLHKEKRKTRAEARKFFQTAPLKVLVPYNKQDCVILHEAISGFERTVEKLGSQLQMTIASTGLQLFRRRYLKEKIETSEAHNSVIELSYFASRVEVFAEAGENFYIYDVNSSFPHAMTSPCPGHFRSERSTIPESGKTLYFADVDIEVPEGYLPPVPYRLGDRIFFPTGRWRSWLSQIDIELLLETGGKLHKVHNVYDYEPCSFLKDFAEEIYEMRRTTKVPFEKTVYKFLMNSVYGKLAEGLVKTAVLIHPDEIDRASMERLMPGVWQHEREAEVAHRHVAMSSWITAIARRTLYYPLKKAAELSGKIMYCDSITSDRTVVLKSPDGRTIIEPIGELWKARGTRFYSCHGGKEACGLGSGWFALARDKRGRTGWFPLKRILRHKIAKKTYLISSKRGQVCVTEDHSLVVGGKEIKPRDFLSKGMAFEVLPSMPSAFYGRGSIDLFEHVRDFKRIVEGSVHHGGRIEHRIEANREWLRYVNYRKNSKAVVKRWYERGSKDLHALLRVCAAYISEGSSSLRGVTTKTRDMFSISQADRKWLSKLKRDLSRFVRGMKMLGPKWSEGSNAFYLRSGAGFLPFLFTAFCGAKSRGKRLPSFIYDLDRKDFAIFWRKLVEGDGSTDRIGRDFYTTNSQQLAAGLSYALGQHEVDHSIHYRRDKRAYAIRTRPAGSERRRSVTHVETGMSQGYVYDLEVEGAHTFVDGLGRVLLHNTDSIATPAVLPSDPDKLGALKLEKKMTWARFAAPKIYQGEGFELQKDGSWKPIFLNKAKGFSLPEDKAAAVKELSEIIEGKEIYVQRMARLRELWRQRKDATPVEVLIRKELTGRNITKRKHLDDGSTRPWNVTELRAAADAARRRGTII